MKLQISLFILFLSSMLTAQDSLISQFYNDIQPTYLNSNDSSQSHLNVIFRKAMAHKELHEYKQAINCLTQIVNNCEDNKRVLTEYGRLLWHTGKLDSAYAVFRLVYNIDSTDIKNNILLAKYYEKQKDYLNVEKIYNQLSTSLPNNIYFRYKQAQAFTQLKNGKDAISLLQLNLKQDSLHINSRYLLFKIYRAMDELDVAIAHMDTLKQIEPDNPEWFFICGQTHYSRNHNYRSIPEFEKAMELGKTDPEIIELLGNSYFNTEEYTIALPYLKANGSLEMNGNRLLKIAQSYLKTGVNDSAMVYFEQAYKAIMPNAFDISATLKGIALIEQEKGHYSTAIKAYEKTTILTQGLKYGTHFSHQNLLAIASIYENELNQPEKALDLFKEKLHSIDKDSDSYRYNYYEKEISRLNEKIFFEGKN